MYVVVVTGHVVSLSVWMGYRFLPLPAVGGYTQCSKQKIDSHERIFGRRPARFSHVSCTISVHLRIGSRPTRCRLDRAGAQRTSTLLSS